MSSHRIERLNSDLRRRISMQISRLKDPRLDPMLEVLRVNVSPDLSVAKVYIASVNGGEAAAEACEVLKGAEGHIKSELAKTMEIRRIPSLVFIPDDSVDYYNHIDSILKGLNLHDTEPADQ